MFRKIAYPFLSLIVLHSIALSQADSLSVSDSLSAAPSGILLPRKGVSAEYAWTVRSFSSDEFSGFPFRGIEKYLPLFPGVVQVNNGLHIRGSRSYEAGYFIDGIDVTNPMYGSNGVELIPEAIDALEVHTGPYGASMGSYNGGIIMSRMKRGGDQLSFSANIQTDKLAHPGWQFLNTTVQGYENAVGTIGGPLPWFDMHFFLAAQRTTYANRQAMFLEPFKYENLVDDGLWRSTNAGRPLPGPVSFGRNWLEGNRSERSTFQGNGSAVIFGVTLSAMGSYDEQEYPLGSEWPNALTNYFNQSRNVIRTKTKFGEIRVSYSLGDLLSASVSYSFYDRFSNTFDPIFKDNWIRYADSAANAQYFDTSRWLSRYTGPDPYSTIYAFRFVAPGTPNIKYSKNKQSMGRWTAELTSNPLPFLKVKAGGSIETWTMRAFDVGNISNLLRFMDQNEDGVPDATYASAYEKRIRYLERGNIRSYGYTFSGDLSDGIKLNGGPNIFLDPPYRPAFASAYVEGSLQSDETQILGGLRYEYHDPEFITVQDPLRIATNWGNYNVALGIMDESKIIPSDASSLVLPRLSIVLSPTEGTRIHAGYGLFAHMPALDPLYYSSYSFSRRIAAEDRSPYGGELSFNVKPERSQQFEIGIVQRINALVTAKITTYAKTLSNQVQLDRFYDTQGTPVFTQYSNAGSGYTKGLEIQCDVAFAPAFSLQLAYSYASAKGLTSSAQSNRVLFSDEFFPVIPVTMRPFDYEQHHKATVILNATTNDKNFFLDGIHITAVVTLGSGHPYTRTVEIRNLGAASPWNIGTYTIRDPRSVDPLEAHNASSTPFTTNLDLRIAKTFDLTVTEVTCYLQVLNVFNTKNVLNVYPSTGTPNDDSWLSSSLSENNRRIPNYESFYRDINLQNRWAYFGATGYDLFGPPRSIQIGVSVDVGDAQ